MTKDDAWSIYLKARRANGRPGVFQALEGQPWYYEEGAWRRRSRDGSFEAKVLTQQVVMRGDCWQEFYPVSPSTS